MLCECLLGIRPDFELWPYFFEVKLHREKGEVLDCGGAIIRPRTGAGYFYPGAADDNVMAARLVLCSGPSEGDYQSGIDTF